MKSQSISYCEMLYFWWGCRGNLKLVTLGSERVKTARGNRPVRRCCPERLNYTSCRTIRSPITRSKEAHCHSQHAVIVLQTAGQWQGVFWLTFAVVVTGTLLFVVLMSADRQKWDEENDFPKAAQDSGESGNASSPTSPRDTAGL